VEKLRDYYDLQGNTLSVWFDNPKKESVCEETDDDVILIKDKTGRVIGFERLNSLSPKERGRSEYSSRSAHGVSFEVAIAQATPFATAVRHILASALHLAWRRMRRARGSPRSDSKAPRSLLP
jgi:hypothetical protein